MRKVTRLIKEAFEQGKHLKVGNTSTDGRSVFLHGNEIIKRDLSGMVWFTFAGWGTSTTRERIKGITGANVYQPKHEQYVYGKVTLDLHHWHHVRK